MLNDDNPVYNGHDSARSEDLPQPSEILTDLFNVLTNLNQEIQIQIANGQDFDPQLVYSYLGFFIQALTAGVEEIYKGAGIETKRAIQIPFDELTRNIAHSSVQVMQFVENILEIKLGYPLKIAKAHAARVGIKPIVFAQFVELMGQPFLESFTVKKLPENEVRYDPRPLIPGIFAYIIDQHMDWKDDSLNPFNSPINLQIQSIQKELVHNSNYLQTKFLEIHTKIREGIKIDETDVFDLFLGPYIDYLMDGGVIESDINYMLISLSDILTGEMIIALDENLYPEMPDYIDLVTKGLSLSSGRKYNTLDFKHVLAVSNVGLIAITAASVLNAKVRDQLPKVDSHGLAEILSIFELAFATSLANIFVRLADDILDEREDKQTGTFNTFTSMQADSTKLFPFFESNGPYPKAIQTMVVNAGEIIAEIGFPQYATRINLLARQYAMNPLIELLAKYKNKSPTLAYYILELGILSHSAAVNGATSDDVMELISKLLQASAQQHSK